MSLRGWELQLGVSRMAARQMDEGVGLGLKGSGWRLWRLAHNSLSLVVMVGGTTTASTSSSKNVAAWVNLAQGGQWECEEAAKARAFQRLVEGEFLADHEVKLQAGHKTWIRTRGRVDSPTNGWWGEGSCLARHGARSVDSVLSSKEKACQSCGNQTSGKDILSSKKELMR